MTGIADVHLYRVPPGQTIDLAQWDTDDRRAFAGSKNEGKAHLEACSLRLGVLQRILAAQAKHKLLIVLQAMDAAGKDNTIRHVFHHVEHTGVNVVCFDRPTVDELAHDFLWRIHQHVPANGEIAIFNRSHYEDVLAVRVRNLAPPEVWQKHYEHIRDFEQLLADNNTTILKFFLHISKEEQQNRLQARLEEQHKRWKFRLGDLKDRDRWSEYMQAYADAFYQTSADHAPWYIVPTDRKWYRNLVIGQIIVDILEGMHLSYPEPPENLDGVIIPD
jgi:PPK2 family polyphosphate:nucleotide phosphotransferase